MDLEKQKLRIYNLIADGKRALIHDDYNNAMAWLDFASQRIDQLKKLNGIANSRITPAQLNRDYIECGGLQWALQNAGTDAENPYGKLYTFDDALTLGNDLWRLPTLKEQEMFIKRTYYAFDWMDGVGVFIDYETQERFELPATKGRHHFNGGFGSLWSSTENGRLAAYGLSFGIYGLKTAYGLRTVARSVRLVRR